jgi:hypothetical protein
LNCVLGELVRLTFIWLGLIGRIKAVNILMIFVQ